MWTIFVSLHFLPLKYFGSIRNYLDLSSTEKLIHAFVTCNWMDYCNSFLYGFPDKEIAKL